MQTGDGRRWWGEALPNLCLPISSPPGNSSGLQGTWDSRHFCSGSIAVNGHCSVKKDKNHSQFRGIVSDALSLGQGREGRPRVGRVARAGGGAALDVGGAAWVRS